MPRSWKPLRVFVSSTFRDMEEEREELVKRVFPRIRDKCERRGLIFNEVDLRWGIADEQAAEGRILPICFAEIERCRPYFIAMLGQRYGWVPDSFPSEVLKAYPWLEQFEGHSITELEIQHGALSEEGSEHSFFYFREPREPDIEEVATLKERIRASGVPVREAYPDAKTLGEWVERDLEALLERDYPESEMPDPLDQEAAEHEAYAAERTAIHVVDTAYGERLTAHAIEDRPPLVVTGEPGSGKSALLANWSLGHRSARPGDVLIEHYVGATPFSADLTVTLRRLLGEIQRRFGIDREVPEAPEEIRAGLPEWLHLTSALLERRDLGADSRLVLVIDGLDRLDDRHGAAELVWLPTDLPPRVSILLSTRPGRAFEAAAELDWPRLEVAPLDEGLRDHLIRAWLGRAGKELGGRMVRRIANSPRAGNPLHLLTLLEELRVYGDYDTLERWIEECLAATTTEGLFELILRRYESDYERDRPHLVRDAMRAIWAARHGLTEPEVLAILGDDGEPMPRAPWSQLALVAQHSIVDRSGLLGFSHDHLRSAVERLYLPDEEEKRRAHLLLARHFAAREFSGRAVAEFPWQLAEGAEWERLRRLLADPESLEALWDAHYADALTFWRRVEEESDLRMVDTLGDVIEDPGRSARHAERVATILNYVGLYPELLQLHRGLLEHTRAAGDEEGVARILISIGQVIRQTEPEKSLELYEEAEEIARRLGLDKQVMAALNSKMLVLRQLRKEDEAAKTLDELEDMAARLDDPDITAVTRSSRAGALRDGGDLDEAAELFEEVERHYRRRGLVHSVAMCLRNRSDILARQGRHDAAMPLLEEQVAINRRLGLRGPLAESLCRLAEQQIPKLLVEEVVANLEEALRITRAKGLAVDHEVAENRARKLADHSKDIAAKVSREGGELPGAILLDCAARIRAAVGDHEEAAEVRARLAESGVDPGQALKMVREAMRQGEMEMRDDPGEELSSRASELMQSSDFASALEILREEEIRRRRGQESELVQCLWNQGMALLNLGDPESALGAFEEVREAARANDDKETEALALVNSVSALWNIPGRRMEVVPLAKDAVGLAEATGSKKLISMVGDALSRIFAT